MKLTLKHLAGYLPYGLEIMFNKTHKGKLIGLIGGDWNLAEVTFNFGNNRKEIDVCFPILHPLSDLTKFREDLGFVPIVELFKISRGCFEMEIKDRYVEIISTNEIQIELGYELYYFSINSFQDCDVRLGSNYFFKTYTTDLRIDNKKDKETYCQNILFQKLYEWHFDIHNLIDNNLAIDINTLKQ